MSLLIHMTCSFISPIIIQGKVRSGVVSALPLTQSCRDSWFLTPENSSLVIISRAQHKAERKGSRISVGSKAGIFTLTHCKWICNPSVDLNCVYCPNHVCMLLAARTHSCICSRTAEAPRFPYTPGLKNI